MPSFEALLQTARDCHELLAAANIAHVIIGGVAVRLHGYARESRDLDLLVRCDDKDRIQRTFQSAQYVWNKYRQAYRSPKTSVRIDFRYSGQDAGNGEIFLPEPRDIQIRAIISGLPVLTLIQLIETKLGCGLNHENGRRKKHYNDVVELIIANGLDRLDVNNLHTSVRAGFCELAHRQLRRQ